MGPITITVHKSVLVTIQGEWPRLLEVKPGDRLGWTVEGGELVVRRSRSVDSLRGSLKSKVPCSGLQAEKATHRTHPRETGKLENTQE